MTRVPHWAYIDSTGVRSTCYSPFLLNLFLSRSQSDFWNASLAQSVGGAYLCQRTISFMGGTIGSITDSPEVTGSASNVPSSTSTGNHSTVTPGTYSPASSKSNSNAGAIAGGVVGGVVGVALIAGFVVRFITRRRRRHAPSADYISGQGSDMSAVPYPMDIVRPKLYVSPFFFPLDHMKAYEIEIDLIIQDPSDPSTYPTRQTSPTAHPSDSSRQHLHSSSDLQPNRRVYHGLPEI